MRSECMKIAFFLYSGFKLAQKKPFYASCSTSRCTQFSSDSAFGLLYKSTSWRCNRTGFLREYLKLHSKYFEYHLKLMKCCYVSSENNKTPIPRSLHMVFENEQQNSKEYQEISSYKRIHSSIYTTNCLQHTNITFTIVF